MESIKKLCGPSGELLLEYSQSSCQRPGRDQQSDFGGEEHSQRERQCCCMEPGSMIQTVAETANPPILGGKTLPGRSGVQGFGTGFPFSRNT